MYSFKFKGRYESLKTDLNATITSYMYTSMPLGHFKFAFWLYESEFGQKLFKADIEVLVKSTIYRKMNVERNG